MKIFNTVQELWSYCRFCPLCQDLTREVAVSVGPDDTFTLKHFHKENEILILNNIFRSLGFKYKVNFTINCITNSFEIDISKPDSDFSRIEKAKHHIFYFYIQSNCSNCHNTYIYGSDIELDLKEKKISACSLEQEGIYLLKKKDKFHICFNYVHNWIEVSRITINPETKGLDESDKPFILPMLKLDFSKPNKVINKIKTLMVFI